MTAKIYGLVRASSLAQSTSCDAQERELKAKADTMAHLGTWAGCFRDPGVNRRVPYIQREGVRELLATLREGDIVIIHALDRLGQYNHDIYSLLHEIIDVKQARMFCLRFNGQEIMLDSVIGRVLVAVFAMASDIEITNLKERIRAGKEWRIAAGYSVNQAPYGKKNVTIIGPDGRKYRRAEWDYDQLNAIQEIVVRHIRGESYQSIANDFHSRGVLNRDGQPWGTPDKRCTTKNSQHVRLAPFVRAFTWYRDMSKVGGLPPGYMPTKELWQGICNYFRKKTSQSGDEAREKIARHRAKQEEIFEAEVVE